MEPRWWIWLDENRMVIVIRSFGIICTLYLRSDINVITSLDIGEFGMTARWIADYVLSVSSNPRDSTHDRDWTITPRLFRGRASISKSTRLTFIAYANSCWRVYAYSWIYAVQLSGTPALLPLRLWSLQLPYTVTGFVAIRFWWRTRRQVLTRYRYSAIPIYLSS